VDKRNHVILRTSALLCNTGKTPLHIETKQTAKKKTVETLHVKTCPKHNCNLRKTCKLYRTSMSETKTGNEIEKTWKLAGNMCLCVEKTVAKKPTTRQKHQLQELNNILNGITHPSMLGKTYGIAPWNYPGLGQHMLRRSVDDAKIDIENWRKKRRTNIEIGALESQADILGKTIEQTLTWRMQQLEQKSRTTLQETLSNEMAHLGSVETSKLDPILYRWPNPHKPEEDREKSRKWIEHILRRNKKQGRRKQIDLYLNTYHSRKTRWIVIQTEPADTTMLYSLGAAQNREKPLLVFYENCWVENYLATLTKQRNLENCYSRKRQRTTIWIEVPVGVGAYLENHYRKSRKRNISSREEQVHVQAWEQSNITNLFTTVKKPDKTTIQLFEEGTEGKRNLTETKTTFRKYQKIVEKL